MTDKMLGVTQWGYYDFFAGGGMVNLGLGSRWRCLLANDISPKKARAYAANFAPATEFILGDVWDLATQDLPSGAELAWASFPCQDLSLAGRGKGLKGERSGSYWGFWRLMRQMQQEGRFVPLLVLENVVGTISANKGRDFQVLLNSLEELGYRPGPIVIDAVHFVPQSRPRLFIVAVLRDWTIPPHLQSPAPIDLWHPKRMRAAFRQASDSIQNSWIWWNLPDPPPRASCLTELIEDDPADVQWHTPEETQRLLDLMNERHLAKVCEAQKLNRRIVGTLYRRIRREQNGVKVQRAEVRFDQTSGCLRTGSGGSSKQFIMEVNGERIRSRLLSGREAARLMGLPDSYRLPDAYGEAYHLLGDGVVVPVVSWLESHILHPLVMLNRIGEDVLPQNTCTYKITQQPLGILKER